MESFILANNISKISEEDNLSNFDCSDPDRNAWLQSRALKSQKSDEARTYVCRARDGAIAGFYAIATAAIVHADLRAVPARLRRNAPDPVSCIVLAQLAVAASYQGQGLGRELVVHAMRKAELVASIAGCRLLLVHPAGSRVADWYGRFGFMNLAVTPGPTMTMSIAQVRALLAAIDAT